jgi:anti-sigma B factor antagonist
MYTRGPVIVMELPEKLLHVEAEGFFQELMPLLEIDRPCVVLDCSSVRTMDSAGVEMLLQCLHETMKRDGDLKLSTVPASSAVILELMRVDRLFEIFDTAEEAVRSFQIFAPAALAHQSWYAPATRLAAADLKVAS